MKKIKEINWFWKNWTESEKKIYKKCAIFAIIVITIQIIAAIMCVNQFHAASDDGRWVTEWNDEKGEWERVWMPWGKGMTVHGDIKSIPTEHYIFSRGCLI